MKGRLGWLGGLGRWGRAHTLAVLWAFYLGPLVVFSALKPAWAEAYAPLLFVVLLATGWVVSWWAAAVVLAGASVLFAVTGTDLIDLGLSLTGGARINRGLTNYVVGLLFLAIGRASKWGRDGFHGVKARAAEAEAARREVGQLALAFRAAAHEIGNPLTPLMLEVSQLRRPENAVQDPVVAKALERIGRNVDRLDRLMRDLHDAARGLRGDLKVEIMQVDLAPLLHDLAHGQSAVAREQGIQWSDEIPATLPCRVDPLRAVQAAANLCQNALRYTPEGSIRFSARIEGATPIIEIRDTGLGFEVEEGKTLFEPFVRAHANRADGAGLGLWLVRGIAQAHGGSVTLTSEGRNKGALATLRLGPDYADGASVPEGATATLANLSTLPSMR